MWDKIDIEIPFHELFVTEFNASHIHSRRRRVKGKGLFDGAILSRESFARAGFVDFRDYDFSIVGKGKIVDGIEVYDVKNAQRWDTISSSISHVAVGFFPEGNGFNEWPHVRVKASPAKILQGHNVFGSERIHEGVKEILTRLAVEFPLIFRHLDVDRAHIRYLDCTYSARIPSKYFTDQIYRLLSLTASSRQRVNANYEDYLKIGCGSDRASLKVYGKEQEFLADLKTAQRTRQKDRIAILENPKLKDFVKDLLRFEATIGFRKMESLGIPTNLKEFLKYHDWYEKVHKQTLCQYLWGLVFNPAFDQIRGHTMKRVDDNAVKARIEEKLKTIDAKGRVSMRKANAVWKTYRQIKAEGYDQLALEHNKTFFRNVNHLIECGFSRAFLKSLDPMRPNDNVFPIVEVINIDFSNQRPDWYEEPVSRAYLRAVA